MSGSDDPLSCHPPVLLEFSYLSKYRTIMTTSCRSSPSANYFSNPDVSFLDKPTVTATEDNACAIMGNKMKGTVYLLTSSSRRQEISHPKPRPRIAGIHEFESAKCAKRSVLMHAGMRAPHIRGQQYAYSATIKTKDLVYNR